MRESLVPGNIADLKRECQAARTSNAAFDALFFRYIEPLDGTLAMEESRRLFGLANQVKSGVIVDVGCHGRSTTSLAYGSLAGIECPVFAVDPHETVAGNGTEDTFGAARRGAFYETVLDGGTWSVVSVIRASSNIISATWPHPVALLQIDSAPNYDSARSDLLFWLPHLQPGGQIVFRGIQQHGPGQVIKELMDAGWILDGPQTGDLAVIRAGEVPPRLPSNWPVSPQSSSTEVGSIETSVRNFDFAIDWVYPRDLLTPKRFDFAAKHIYARLREKNVKSDWGRFVYAFHLSLWNGFFEDSPRKVCEADFLESFHGLINDTRQTPEKGLRSIIPLASNGAPLNGAHRIIAALLHGKQVACVRTETPSTEVDYDQRFFETRAASAENLHASDVLDAMALEFCRILSNIAIAIRFPSTKGHDDEVERILSEHAVIFYRKTVTLENDGPVHLMRTLYEKEPWLGTPETDFDGARSKADLCFNRPGPARFFLLAFKDHAELRRAKERVRELFRVEKHSMHITDTRDEALRVAKLAFSNASIQFVNSRSTMGMPVFNRILSIYRSALALVGDPDDFCVDGSAVLAAYGIRDCADFDYISHEDQRLEISSKAPISSHNEYGEYYEESTLDDIIYRHCNHFYLEGMKFASLAKVRNWKQARGEPKDYNDVALIDAWAARHDPSLANSGARSTLLRLRNSFFFMRKRIIRSLKKSSLNSFRWRIIKSLRRAPK